jgi:hypothetical protein
MSSFSITKLYGGEREPIEVTHQGLARLMAKPLTIGPLLRELGPDNTVKIDLKEGPALIRRGSGKPRQLNLPKPVEIGDLPIQDYLADVQLKFVLPARVQCSGRSPAEVREKIVDVVHGQCGMPGDFHIQIRPNDISALIGKMEIGDVTVIDEVEITGVMPHNQRAITDGRKGARA